MSRLIQLIVIAALLFFAWRWWQQHQGTSPTHAVIGGGDGCTPYVDSATNAWSNGIRKFTSGPPYDTAAWDSFRSSVESRIGEADSHCSCDRESCSKGKEAMNGLRDMMSNVDGMIRNNGAPPSDLVQRQENVDNLAEQAHELASQGK
jgi:hypothetical protein